MLWRGTPFKFQDLSFVIFNKTIISNDDEMYTHYFADSSYTNKMQVEWKETYASVAIRFTVQLACYLLDLDTPSASINFFLFHFLRWNFGTFQLT